MEGMAVPLLIASIHVACNGTEIRDARICQSHLQYINRGPRSAPKASDIVPICNVLYSTCRFIAYQRACKVPEDDISNYLHLTKESWRGDARWRWLQGLEKHDGVYHLV